jgi:hypothetical protein
MAKWNPKRHSLKIGQSLSTLENSFVNVSRCCFVRAPFICFKYEIGDKINEEKYNCRVKIDKLLKLLLFLKIRNPQKHLLGISKMAIF